MQFSILTGLLALTGYASAVSINVSGYADNFDCEGRPSFNQLIENFVCNRSPISSTQVFPGSGDSNGCKFETYYDVNCQIFASRTILSGGISSCSGQVNPNTGELRQNYSFRLVCDE